MKQIFELFFYPINSLEQTKLSNKLLLLIKNKELFFLNNVRFFLQVKKKENHSLIVINKILFFNKILLLFTTIKIINISLFNDYGILYQQKQFLKILKNKQKFLFLQKTNNKKELHSFFFNPIIQILFFNNIEKYLKIFIKNEIKKKILTPKFLNRNQFLETTFNKIKTKIFILIFKETILTTFKQQLKIFSTLFSFYFISEFNFHLLKLTIKSHTIVIKFLYYTSFQILNNFSKKKKKEENNNFLITIKKQSINFLLKIYKEIKKLQFKKNKINFNYFYLSFKKKYQFDLKQLSFSFIKGLTQFINVKKMLLFHLFMYQYTDFQYEKKYDNYSKIILLFLLHYQFPIETSFLNKIKNELKQKNIYYSIIIEILLFYFQLLEIILKKKSLIVSRSDPLRLKKKIKIIVEKLLFLSSHKIEFSLENLNKEITLLNPNFKNSLSILETPIYNYLLKTKKMDKTEKKTIILFLHKPQFFFNYLKIRRKLKKNTLIQKCLKRLKQFLKNKDYKIILKKSWIMILAKIEIKEYLKLINNRIFFTTFQQNLNIKFYKILFLKLKSFQQKQQELFFFLKISDTINEVLDKIYIQTLKPNKKFFFLWFLLILFLFFQNFSSEI